MKLDFSNTLIFFFWKYELIMENSLQYSLVFHFETSYCMQSNHVLVMLTHFI